MKALQPIRRIVFACAAIILLNGCDKKVDLSAIVSDAAGLREGDPVYFMGTEAGEVGRLIPDGGKIKVAIILKPEFRAQVRAGAKARAVCDLTSGFSSQLRIIGGADGSNPVLAAGSIIPEASAFDRMGEVVRGVAQEGANALEDIATEVKAHVTDEAMRQIENLRTSVQRMQDESRERAEIRKRETK